jgi:hypothetical protein
MRMTISLFEPAFAMLLRFRKKGWTLDQVSCNIGCYSGHNPGFGSTREERRIPERKALV